MTFLWHTWVMTVRHVMRLIRQPWYIAVTLVQPIVWLLLYGALFRKAVEIPGFKSDSYIEFLAPGVIVMSALFSSGWGGMALIDDLNRGVIDRFLVTPVHRAPLILGRLVQASIVVVVQSVIIVLLAMATGARFASLPGVAVLILVAAMVGAAFGAISYAIALLARREETVIAVMNFTLLPLTFLSAGFMQKDLMPGWMQRVADFNPVNWAVEAGRVAAAGGDWGFVGLRVLLLAGFLALGLAASTSAFRAYQRSA
ncbi:MAG: ABC transporter permease [Dehalococcoidia bacterium]